MRSPYPEIRPDRVVRWRSRPDALPLTFSFRAHEGVPDVFLVVGVGERPAWVAFLPYCGCDACDDGSAYLLEELDGLVEQVVTGSFLRVDTAHGHAETTRDGLTGANVNVEEAERLLAEARAGASPHRVTAGAPWL